MVDSGMANIEFRSYAGAFVVLLTLRTADAVCRDGPRLL